VAREHRLLWALVLGITLFVAELSLAFLSRSLALLADSGHLFLDVFALGLAFWASLISGRKPDQRYTYGYHRAEVLAAALNAFLLYVLAGFVVYEALERLRSPVSVLPRPMLAMAVAGLFGNFLTAWLLGSHGKHDLNMRAAFLHVLGDALGSVAVLVAALATMFFGAAWVDPAASLLISGIILFGASRVLRQALKVLAEGVPEGLSLAEIAAAITSFPGVREVHDLHVWSIGPRFPVLTAHLVVGDLSLREAEALGQSLRKMLRERFGIEHVTFQMEGGACSGPSCNGPSEGKKCAR